MKTIKFSRTSKINIGDFAISECIEFLHLRADKGTIDSYDLLDESFDIHTRITQADPNRTYPVKRRGKLASFFVLTLKRLLFITRERNKFKGRLNDADAVIIGGGNILAEINGGDMFYRCYSIFKMAQKRNIPVYVYGVGLGPFDFSYKSRLKKLIRGARQFVVRDHRAYTFCEQINDKEVLGKVKISVDPAFVISDMFEPLPMQKRAIGVNFMNFAKLVPGSGFDYHTVARHLKEVSDNYQLPVKIINTSFGEDLSIALNVKNLLEAQGVNCSIANIDQLDKLPEIFSDLKFFVASRMHSSIFAMAYKIPTLIFPWHHKVDGLCSHIFGQNKAQVLLQSPLFDPQEIRDKIATYDNNIDLSDVIDQQKAAIYKEYDQLFK